MEIDWSLVAFEVLNFGVLVLVVRRFLFRPVREALEKRRSEIESERDQTEQREAAANSLREEYEAKLQQIDEEARRRLDTALNEARNEAGRIVDSARDEGRRLTEAAASEVDNAQRLALQGLRKQVIELAVDAAKQLVGHAAAPSVARAYAHRGATSLLDALDGEIPTGPAALDIGADADPAELEAAVREVLGATVELEVHVDPNIVAGVRLRCGPHEVSASASATLERWYEARVSNTPAPRAMLEPTG